MNLAVRGPRVLVRTENQTITERPSGIVTVEAYAPDVMGTVVACGDVQEVKVDDVVVFPPSAGQALDVDGCTYLVLQEDELLAIWE